MPELTSWNVTLLTSDAMHIQLGFSNPYLVSNIAGSDWLDVKFKNTMIFKSMKDNRTIDGNYTVTQIFIPQQFTSPEQKK